MSTNISEILANIPDPIIHEQCQHCGCCLAKGDPNLFCPWCHVALIEQKHKAATNCANASPSPPSILSEAAEIIQGPRREAYGPAKESFARIAAVWSQLFKHEFSARDVALAMIAFKLLREANKANRDNRVDLAGYTALLDQIESAESGLAAS